MSLEEAHTSQRHEINSNRTVRKSEESTQKKTRHARKREEGRKKVVIYKSAADISVTNTDRRGEGGVAAHMTAHWPPSLTSVASAQSCITVKTAATTTTKQSEESEKLLTKRRRQQEEILIVNCRVT